MVVSPRTRSKGRRCRLDLTRKSCKKEGDVPNKVQKEGNRIQACHEAGILFLRRQQDCSSYFRDRLLDSGC